MSIWLSDMLLLDLDENILLAFVSGFRIFCSDASSVGGSNHNIYHSFRNRWREMMLRLILTLCLTIIQNILFVSTKMLRNVKAYLLLLLLPTTHSNSNPSKVNTATHAPPSPQSIQSIPLCTIPRRSNFQ